MLLVSSVTDVVFVDTMNLDGETNLKEKFVFAKDKYHRDSAEDFAGFLNCDPPNENLDEWDGNLTLSNDTKAINCNIKNMLLRGCSLRNTDHAIGLVVYVGFDSKVMKNAKKSPKKVSHMMVMMNWMLYSVFIF